MTYVMNQCVIVLTVNRWVLYDLVIILLIDDGHTLHPLMTKVMFPFIVAGIGSKWAEMINDGRTLHPLMTKVMYPFIVSGIGSKWASARIKRMILNVERIVIAMDRQYEISKYYIAINIDKISINIDPPAPISDICRVRFASRECCGCLRYIMNDYDFDWHAQEEDGEDWKGQWVPKGFKKALEAPF
mmetsp:Transcript_17445/g.56584  ORF Transcript_17445/g.56584 Transcript_17445/m.56584 type:complete len:187 (-) Transcript_17445:777-1337(-)